MLSDIVRSLACCVRIGHGIDWTAVKTELIRFGM